MKYIIIICFCCFVNCNNTEKLIRTEDTNVFLFLDYKIIGDSIIENKIENIPQMSYRFISLDSGFILHEIKVYRDTKLIQKITVNEPFDKKQIRLIDWNFDGYKDISVVSECGSAGCSYLIWNYVPTKYKYEFNDELSNKIGLELDSVAKKIIFHYRFGFAEENWDTFKYIDNKLEFEKGLYRTRFNNEKGDCWLHNYYSKKVRNKIINSEDSVIIIK
jgi:hypothetical protein